MIVLFTLAAIRDAVIARDAFADRDPRTVAGFRNRLTSAVTHLADFPEIGRIAADGTRRLPLLPYPYLLIYEVVDGRVVVLAVAPARSVER